MGRQPLLDLRQCRTIQFGAVGVGLRIVDERSRPVVPGRLRISDRFTRIGIALGPAEVTTGAQLGTGSNG